MRQTRDDKQVGIESRVSPFADERIIFRTRDDVLTDRRLITGGMTYSLAELKAVRVVNTGLYLPVQLARGVALFVGTVLLVFAVAGWFGNVALPLDPLLYFLAAIPCVLFVLRVVWLLPIFAVELQTRSGRVRVMRSSDLDTLHSFAVHIHALRQRREGAPDRG